MITVRFPTGLSISIQHGDVRGPALRLLGSAHDSWRFMGGTSHERQDVGLAMPIRRR